MSLLSDFPSPTVAREAFVHGSGYTEKGTPLLTLEALEAFSKGRGSRTERRYRCPFCGATEAAFHVNVETGAFNCKRSTCGVKGCLREFWKETQPTFQGRGKARGRGPSAFVLSPEKPFQPTTGGNWRDLWNSSFELDAKESKSGRDYLNKRGISLDVAKRAGVRFSRNWAPSVDSKSYTGGAAVLFPLTNRAGEVVAVGSRYLNPWTSPEGDTIKARVGGDKVEGVFRAPVADGLDPLKAEQPVIVEGPIDALALASCGAPAVAANGVSFPTWLPHALAFKSLFLAPDGDEGGSKALKDWRRDIGPFAPRLRVLNVAEELGVKDFGAVIENDGPEVLTAWLEGASVLPIENSDETTEIELAQPLPKAWRDRDAAYWQRVRESVLLGVQKICAVIQSYPLLFDALKAEQLPPGGCRIVVTGETHDVEDAAGMVAQILAEWAERAATIYDEGRDLTPEEEEDLRETSEALEWLNAANMGDHWADLEGALESVGEAAQIRARQLKAQRERDLRGEFDMR